MEATVVKELGWGFEPRQKKGDATLPRGGSGDGPTGGRRGRCTVGAFIELSCPPY